MGVLWQARQVPHTGIATGDIRLRHVSTQCNNDNNTCNSEQSLQYYRALVLMATMNFGAYVHPEVSNLGLDANGATALYAFEQITAAISNMSLAAVWLRTAVALTQILSKHRRPRLVRYTKSVGRWAYVVLAVLALVSLATEIWFERVLAALPSNRSTVPAPEQNPLTMARITSLTLDICYVVYTATLIPLILWQLMGRRMDKVSYPSFTPSTAANSNTVINVDRTLLPACCQLLYRYGNHPGHRPRDLRPQP